MQYLLINILILSFCIYGLCNPTLSPWPRNFFTWADVTITPPNRPAFYNIGQLLAYDVDNQYICGADQQNLLNPSNQRLLELCDYQGGRLYRADNSTPGANCTLTQPLGGNLKPIEWPTDFVQNAVFMGTDMVNQLSCNHFYAQSVNISGRTVQLDAWLSVSGGLPCEVVVTDSNAITTWAFDGFTDQVTQLDYERCFIAEDTCRPDLLCQAKSSASDQDLIAALSWVCNPSILDCSPIQPGGAFYVPDTPKDHSNWAFNAYYQINRRAQGPQACDFGGTAYLNGGVNPNPGNPPPSGSITFTTLFASTGPAFDCPSYL